MRSSQRKSTYLDARTDRNMKKTYVTKMPDKAGAFLLAGRIISKYDGNIIRVNYNKAVDLHTLFIEVSATKSAHEKISKELLDCGYLFDATTSEDRQILMIVLKLADKPGSVAPVLEILKKFNANISYISSQENGTDFQYFKMGLLIENAAEIKNLIDEISKICEIKILDYEVTDRLLDGAVFYVSFANEMRNILNLNQKETNEVLVYANKIMQNLDEQKKSPLKTFDYIRRFAKFVKDKKGENFNAKISTFPLKSAKTAEHFTLFAVEPPCGSNAYVIRSENAKRLLFIDSGFSCYLPEMRRLFYQLFPNFDLCEKICFITHADVDHVGLSQIFDKIYMNQNCYDNFSLEKSGKKDFREQIPFHEPYSVLSKIISDYKTPDLEKCEIVGESVKSPSQKTLTPLGAVNFCGLNFDFYEGKGGHVKGETIIFCDELRLLFTGDIFVNIKGFSEEQKEFNSIAPFLMTGVDANPKLAKETREFVMKKFKGNLVCPGHGATFCSV